MADHAYSPRKGERPRLVLVHATRFDSSQWRGYERLIPDAEVVTVDLPGHGARAGAGFTIDTALAVIDEAITAAGERPVALAGHSLGGYLAATYAERNPRSLGALALLGAMGDPAAHPVLIRLYTDFPRWIERVGADRMAHTANRVMTRVGVGEADLPNAVGYDVVEDAWSAVIDTCGPHQLRDLRMPVWLLTGTLDQLGIDTRAYRLAATDARSVVFPRATHIFPLTHKEQTAAALARMVREMCAANRPARV